VSLQTKIIFIRAFFSIFSKVGYRVGLHVDTSVVYEIVYVICKKFRILGFRPHFTYYVGVRIM
jgi:hypothetical protein